MTVPAREVQVGWRVNPGTPSEWVVARSIPWDDREPARWVLHDDDLIFMRVPPDQLIDAAPPPRMITVPAMDDETRAIITKQIATGKVAPSQWKHWLETVLAAHEREAT